MLLGLAFPTDGRAELLGAPMPAAAIRVLPRVGSLIEGPAFYPFLTGQDNLARCDAADRTADPRTAAARISEALDQVGLLAAARKRYRHYSLGMKQRLAIAASLLTPRELIVLDEPTNGLDPQGTREVRGAHPADRRGRHHRVRFIASAGRSRAGLLARRRDAYRTAGVPGPAGGAARQRRRAHPGARPPSRPRRRRSSNGLASPTRRWQATRCRLSSQAISLSGSARNSSGRGSGSAGSAWSPRSLEDLFVGLTGEGFEIDG